MCSPTIALLAVSTAITAYAGVKQAQNERAVGHYQEAVANQNAKLSKQQAADANTIGARQASEERLKTRLLIGQQRTALAANGVEINSGTPLEILGDTATQGAANESMIRYNAARKAWGYQVQGTDYTNQGQLANFQGQSKAQGTMLGTAASIAGTWGNYYTRGK